MAFERTDDSAYTNLSESDSNRILGRHDLEYVSGSNKTPNTWSYSESQLQTPCQSVDSKEPLSATAMPTSNMMAYLNYIVMDKE